MKTRNTKMKGGAIVIFALALLGAQACGDDDTGDDAPVIGAGRGGGQSGGKDGKGGEGGADAESGGPGQNEGGRRPQGGRGNTTGGTGGGTVEPDPQGGVGNDGGTGPGEGGSPGSAGAPSSDCFQNPKKTDDENLEFLNQCTRSRCAKFDNFARIKGFTGTLPNL